MSTNTMLRGLSFKYTRKTQRKTKPHYYRAVRVGSGIIPIWVCKHKHESRFHALNCYVETVHRTLITEEEKLQLNKLCEKEPE